MRTFVCVCFTIVSIAVECLKLCCLSFGKVDDLLREVHYLCHVYTKTLVTHPRPHMIEKGQSLIRHLSSHMTIGYRSNLVGKLRQFMKVRSE